MLKDTYCGSPLSRTLADEDLLYSVGVRDDDTLMLEFQSPAMPTQLKHLRSASAPTVGTKNKKGSTRKKSPKRNGRPKKIVLDEE